MHHSSPDRGRRAILRPTRRDRSRPSHGAFVAKLRAVTCGPDIVFDKTSGEPLWLAHSNSRCMHTTRRNRLLRNRIMQRSPFYSCSIRDRSRCAWLVYSEIMRSTNDTERPFVLRAIKCLRKVACLSFIVKTNTSNVWRKHSKKQFKPVPMRLIIYSILLILATLWVCQWGVRWARSALWYMRW